MQAINIAHYRQKDHHMPITFFYGSGSPFSWYVWFVLEHKQLPYELRLMSLQGGDLKTPEYLTIHPRGKVPALMDDGEIFRESIAIVEYLEDHYPHRPVLPSCPEDRATVRRLVLEAFGYLYPPLRRLMEKTLMRGQGRASSSDLKVIEGAVNDVRQELDYFERIISGSFLCGSISAADFALYPLLALVSRIRDKRPQFSIALSMGPKLTASMQEIEQLPYFDKTYPPHWKG